MATQSFSPSKLFAGHQELVEDVENLFLPDPSASIPATFRQLSLVQESQIKPADTFSILVASDVHLGYADRDEVRKMDSFRSFEEVLRIAKERNVDFVLLGGDLFHENKPSRFTAQQCATLLRTYCMGEAKVKFQLVSDPAVNFAHMEPHFRRVNTEDPDLKISLPVYSIHGNHDDPSGLKYLSELDLLHTYGLINYFGKANDVENIEINPLLLTKGSTKLAIYGLGSIRDERLHRAYLSNSVIMKRPAEDQKNWFSIFLLHQNRPSHRGVTNFIPEEFLEKWLDLVIWGHEHDPIPVPEYNHNQGFEVLQPGSTVATSMSEGEGKQKFCYLLKVCGTKYRVDPIPLETVRPFCIEEVNLSADGFLESDANGTSIRQDVEQHLAGVVERIVGRTARDRKPDQPKEPLIRLRVDFGNTDPLNPILFGQKFVGRVANPRDIILPVKQRIAGTYNNGSCKENGNGFVVQTEPVISLDTATIEDLVVKQFAASSEELIVFDPKLLSEALRIYVHSDDKDVINDVYAYQKSQVQNYLDEHDDIDIGDVKKICTGLREFRRVYDDNTGKYMADFGGWRNNRGHKAVQLASNGTSHVLAKTQIDPDTITVDEDNEFDINVSLNLPVGSDMPSTSYQSRYRTIITSSNSSNKRSTEVTPPPAKRARGRGSCASRPRGRGRNSKSITDYF